MELSTRYLGLRLAHPFMPGASPLADDLDMVLRLEDAGASAIVMRSMFEEQIAWERFRGIEPRVRLHRGTGGVAIRCNASHIRAWSRSVSAADCPDQAASRCTGDSVP